MARPRSSPRASHSYDKRQINYDTFNRIPREPPKKRRRRGSSRTASPQQPLPRRCFASVPIDCYLVILSFCDAYSLKYWRLVSKHWKQHVETTFAETFWNLLYGPMLDKYTYPIGYSGCHVQLCGTFISPHCLIDLEAEQVPHDYALLNQLVLVLHNMQEPMEELGLAPIIIKHDTVHVLSGGLEKEGALSLDSYTPVEYTSPRSPANFIPSQVMYRTFRKMFGTSAHLSFNNFSEEEGCGPEWLDMREIMEEGLDQLRPQDGNPSPGHEILHAVDISAHIHFIVGQVGSYLVGVRSGISHWL